MKAPSSVSPPMAAEGYERDVVKPRLDAAGSSCEATATAMPTVIGYERQPQLLGFGTSTNARGRQPDSVER